MQLPCEILQRLWELWQQAFTITLRIRKKYSLLLLFHWLKNLFQEWNEKKTCIMHSTLSDATTPYTNVVCNLAELPRFGTFD